LTGKEAGEVTGHLVFCAGWPNATSAAAVASVALLKVLQDRSPCQQPSWL